MIRYAILVRRALMLVSDRIVRQRGGQECPSCNANALSFLVGVFVIASVAFAQEPSIVRDSVGQEYRRVEPAHFEMGAGPIGDFRNDDFRDGFLFGGIHHGNRIRKAG